MKTQRMKNVLLAFLLIILTISAPLACFANPKDQAKVYHIVICWLKDPGNLEQRERLIEETKKLMDIPGILSIEVGTMLPSTRPVVDSTFDIGIIMSFTDEEAMNEYLLNPSHQKATKEVLAPLTAKVVVYDFEKSE